MSDRQEAIESAIDGVCDALGVCLAAAEGGRDIDIDGCTFSHLVDVLKKVRVDLRAAGATDDDPLDDIEYESQYAMHQAQIAIDKQRLEACPF